LGLDKKGIEAALGIAASLASGIRINFGTMTKPLHVGNAARNGVLASLLASRRFTATANIFDHELDFGQVFSEDDMDKNHLIESLGSPWDILSPGVTVKKYPCCNKTHRTLDATLKLALDKGIHPDNIATIVVTIPPGEDVPLIYNKATTPLEGKFSMQFCVASAIVDGKIDFDTFTSKNVARHQVQQLSDKVLVVTDENQAPVVIDSGGHVTVTITMKDGSSMDRRISKATGTPTYPLSDHELNEKFTACASKAIDSKEIEKALERIYSLDYVTTVAQLMEPLCPSLLVGVNHD
jgi:2-methylcitrate dehydratase PrpD